MKKLTASPKGFPLFSCTSKLRRPTLREVDAALLVCDTLLSKQISSATPSLWDLLSSLNLPPTQESWVRALIMDVAGASPYTPEPRARESLYRAYLSRARTELRALHRELSARTPTTPFSVLERLF